MTKTRRMSLRSFIILMSFVTLICWVAWVLVLLNIDPDTSGFIGYFAFYLSLFLALVGTFGLIGFFVRYMLKAKTIPFRHLGVSVRQAILFSILLVAALMLQGQRFLTWYNILFLVAGLTILEFFFISRKSS